MATTKIRRIKAQEAEMIEKPTPKLGQVSKPKSTGKAKKLTQVLKPKKRPAPAWLKAIGRPFAPMGRYLKGSWAELRQTKWPNRKSAWALTLAVIIFSVFFAVLIVAIDQLFDFIIKNVIL